MTTRFSHVVQREALLRVLEINGGSIAATARALKMQRRTLDGKIDRFGIRGAAARMRDEARERKRGKPRECPPERWRNRVAMLELLEMYDGSIISVAEHLGEKYHTVRYMLVTLCLDDEARRLRAEHVLTEIKRKDEG